MWEQFLCLKVIASGTGLILGPPNLITVLDIKTPRGVQSEYYSIQTVCERIRINELEREMVVSDYWLVSHDLFLLVQVSWFVLDSLLSKV